MKDIYLYENTSILKNKLDIKNQEELNLAEADYLLCRILEVEKLAIDRDINIHYFKLIHKYLFQDIYEWAGEFRKIDIEKYERALNGLSVKYEDFLQIENKLNTIFEIINKTDVISMSKKELVEHITDIIADMWEVHAFREGNTRTVVLFIYKYLQKYNININKDIFKDNSQYVRDALVAATFEDIEINVYKNKTYLLRVIEDALNI